MQDGSLLLPSIGKGFRKLVLLVTEAIGQRILLEFDCVFLYNNNSSEFYELHVNMYTSVINNKRNV